jgi:hypothetical protein
MHYIYVCVCVWNVLRPYKYKCNEIIIFVLLLLLLNIDCYS